MNENTNEMQELAVTETDFNQAIDASGRIWQQMALRVTGNCADADEAVQRALIAAWTRRQSFRGEAALSSWIGRMVLNQAYNILRRDRRERLRQSEFVRRTELALENGKGGESRIEALQLAVASLSGELHEAAAMMLATELDCAVAAERLGWPVKKLYKRWERAKEKLKQVLENLS